MLTIPLDVSELGGITSSDYTIDTMSLTFEPFQTSATVTVTARDDGVNDGAGEGVIFSFGTLPAGLLAEDPVDGDGVDR